MQPPPQPQQSEEEKDPYHLVKESVAQQLISVRTLVNTWKAQGYPLHVAHNARNSISAIIADINDLDQTIGVVQRDPKRFRLTQDDIYSRRQFISNSQSFIKDLQAEINSGMIAYEKQQRSALLVSPSSPLSESTPHKSNADYSSQKTIDAELGRQQLMMRTQDQQLDSVLNTVNTLKQVAVTMGDEIEDQIGLMQEMENEVDNTQGHMHGVLRKMDQLMKASNDTKATWLIIVLTITLLVLVIFVLV